MSDNTSLIDRISYVNTYKAFNANNYRFYGSGSFNINIFGIRNKSRLVDSFDDYLCVAYCSEKGEKQLEIYPCTLDPGSYYLKNLMDAGGAAGIAPAQYKNLWVLGEFHNTPALIQVNNVTVYRDGNKDNKLDWNKNKTTTGIYGIFCHETFQKAEVATTVYNSSGGCVVPQKRGDMNRLIELCKKQVINRYGNMFTFTLFEEEEYLSLIN